MLNQEIYNRLLLKHGMEKMKVFSEIIRDMYLLRTQDPPPKLDDAYDLHFWSLKNIHLNINTHEDGTDRENIQG